jgi:hypothetical protein
MSDGPLHRKAPSRKKTSKELVIQDHKPVIVAPSSGQKRGGRLDQERDCSCVAGKISENKTVVNKQKG